jgi:hypothetical protein
MKRFVAVMVLSALLVGSVMAQEEPIPPKRSRALKVGLFAGFTPGWLFMDLKPVNDFIVGGGGAPLNDGGLFLSGGAGAVYIMVLPNVRVGGVGMGGGTSSSVVGADGIRRDTKMGVGYGGITFEYVVPLFERFDFAAGAMFGWGGMDITLRQSNGGSNTWSGEQKLFGTWAGGTMTGYPNITRVLSGSFFVWVPSVNLEYAVTGWLAFRAGASYVGMSFPSWSVDGEYDLLDVPSSVSGKGFMVQAGIMVGTF